MTRYADRFRRIARSFNRFELTRQSMDEGFPRNAEELLREPAEERRFLDFYGDDGLLLALERYGLLGALRRRGFLDFRLETHAREERHSLFIDACHITTPTREYRRIVDLVVRADTLRTHPGAGGTEPLRVDVLTVDWLALQNPFASFTERRPRSPGQIAPGLGIGEQVLELLHLIVKRLRLGGVLTVAEYFHNAVLYARELPFFDPTHAGRLQALAQMLLQVEELSLTQASWALQWGLVQEDDTVVRWRGEPQLRPTDPLLRQWLSSDTWAEAASAARAAYHPRLDRESFGERWELEREGLLLPPSDREWPG